MWRNFAALQGVIIMQVESPKLRLLANDADDIWGFVSLAPGRNYSRF